MYNKGVSKKFRAAFFVSAAILSAAVFLASCQSAKKSRDKNLRLLFAGDIMAHTQNFSMPDYAAIWDDIREQVGAADYAFANLESPVVEDRPFESYPTFNMKASYPAAAFDAGFNLISLANNHTNDQGTEGIKATARWAQGVESQGQKGGKKASQDKDAGGKKASQDRNAAAANKNGKQAKNAGGKKIAGSRPAMTGGIHFSGLTENGQMSYREFFWHEYKIAFIAVTELLNTWKNYEVVNYVPPTQKGRAAFVQKIADMKAALQPDLFIVSVHTSEEEYVLTALDSVKKFYHELLDAGADIVVSNHPHVVRPLELVAEKESKKIRKAIIYANGNTISGQRRVLNYEDPNEIWNYTGDGRLVEFEMALDEEGFFALNYKSTFITAYTPQGERSPVIKRLDDNFIKTLAENGEKKNSEYYKARLAALKKIKDIWTWR